jgi:hypothetical protein
VRRAGEGLKAELRQQVTGAGLGGATRRDQRLQLVPSATVLRNEVLPAKIPAGGLVIVRDGDLGEPEVTLNPVSYHFMVGAPGLEPGTR